MCGLTLSLTSTLDGVGVQRTIPVTLPPGKRPGTHCIGGWKGLSGQSGRVSKISLPTGIRPLDRPARRRSQYRLSCLGSHTSLSTILKCRVITAMLLRQIYVPVHRKTHAGLHMSVLVTAPSKKWVCGRSPADIVGSNPAEGMDVCLL